MAKNSSTVNEYSAEKIQVLQGLEAVRKRPGMYIGSTGSRGLHHLIHEVVDNSIDEAMAGYCDEINAIIHKNNSVTIIDNARGIPVDEHPIYKKPAVEVIISSLHAGGKFDHATYKVSGGLHGVGLSVVCALSQLFTVKVKRDGKIYQQHYLRGEKASELTVIGECDSDDTGTTITFLPDEEIFDAINYDYEIINDRFKELAFLNKGVKLSLKDERPDEPEYDEYYSDNGIIAYVEYLSEDQELINNPIYFEKERESVVVEIAMSYTKGYTERIYTFVNNIGTQEGGTHLEGFRGALTRSINNYARKKSLLKDNEANFEGSDVREGLCAIINLRVPEPQFEGQTKTKLGNSEVKGIVASIVYDQLSAFLEQNFGDSKLIIEKCKKASEAREAARKARLFVQKRGLSFTTQAGKLVRCAEKDPTKSELFLVEGNSAGGCFSGETKVALMDGRNLSFLELIEEERQGKENFCYTILNDGSIGIEKILNPRKTGTNRKVIKIVLDTDEEIICTPNHRFMLRDGSYKEAQELKRADSLMPLVRRVSTIENKIAIEGNEMVLDTSSNKWVFTHILADKYNLRNSKYSVDIGDIRHQTAFNKVNNNPTNIFREKQSDFEKALKTVKIYNHKIKSIESINIPKDVYDIEVPNTHNFALTKGVFVHNSAKQGRDAKFQAILPLRGKVLNVEKARKDHILKNKEIISIVAALGTGIQMDDPSDDEDGDETKEKKEDLFDISRLRYHKVILMMDADIDGAHIKTLLLTFFYRYMKPIVEHGNLYIAVSPLYRVDKGKKRYYAYSDAELEELLERIGKKGIKQSRFKGLGEMSWQELQVTTMDPESRVLHRVTIEDLERSETIFTSLMGEYVKLRREYIERYAFKATLDI
ncbi:MAG: ATP-binding protein [Candidatus Hodarchaeota archaeon]